MRRLGVLALAGVGASLAFAASANAAATIVVDTNLDSGTDCTLRQAIIAADTDAIAGGCSAGDGNDDIVFDPGVTGEINVGANGPLAIAGSAGDVEIEGPGATTLAVDGGGISRVFNVDGENEISDLTIRDGSADGGAGIVNDGILILNRVRVIANVAAEVNPGPGLSVFADAIGGGIANFGDLTVNESYVADNVANATATGGTNTNTAQARGGGIWSDAGSELTVQRSAFSGNAANANATGAPADNDSALGGAISATSLDPSSVELSTFWDNSAAAVSDPGQAVGASVHGDSSLTLTSDTITGGEAAGTGSNLFGASAMPIQNTIIADPDPTSVNCFGVDSLGHNLSDDVSCDHVINDDLVGEPNLLPPGDYGGPTQTRPPAPPAVFPPGPIAIDGGIAAGQTTDARGLPRTWNFDAPNLSLGDGTDIGAVEIQGPTPLGTTPASPSDGDQPRIFGSAETAAPADTTVQLYSDGACSPPSASAGLPAGFASPGLESSPLALGLTTFTTKLSYGALTSDCSASIGYNRVAVTPPPTPPVTTPPATTPPATTPPTARKKCKKGRKLKRGRCVKKKRRK